MSYTLIKTLLVAGLPNEARLVAELYEREAEREPRLKAVEHELKWLVEYMRRDGVEMVLIDDHALADQDRRHIVGASMPVMGAALERGEIAGLAIPSCPRLDTLLNGNIPSLKDGTFKP